MKSWLAVFLVVCLLGSSCVTTDKCSIKINKKKFNYYNQLQFGGSTAKKKKG